MPTGNRLEGKVALITGAGSGIGRGTARLLASEGAAIAVADLNGETADQTTAQITEAGGRAISIAGDVSTHSGAASIVDTALTGLGRLDVLVNNAGVAESVPLTEITEAHAERLIAVNLKGPIYMAQYAVAAMIDGGNGGAIVNIASMTALRARPDAPVYVATKGGITAFTRSLAIDFARHGIRANCVCPSMTETPMMWEHFEKLPDGAEQYRLNQEAVPLGRLAQPLDIAHAVLYLASDEAAYVTGQILAVEGGSTAGISLY